MAGRKQAEERQLEETQLEGKERETAGKKTKRVKKQPGIEECFERLDEITEQMEKGEITLEQSFSLFQEGMELAKQCGRQLEDVEKKMIILQESEENEF